MDTTSAQRVVESLRLGIPPEGLIRQFTVGRNSEMKDLASRLDRGERGALLVEANYGSGKTHLLKFIRETALQAGYAASLVTLDAQSAVRFNRMDQILGAIWRNLEIPNGNSCKGPRPFLDLLCSQIEAAKATDGAAPFWGELTNHWKWDFSNVLESQAFYLGLRAWATGEEEVKDTITDWLLQPWKYYTRRKPLYQLLVESLRKYFRDPRPAWMFYNPNEGFFNFQMQRYQQSWACLADLHRLAQEAGLKGVVLLFDEFEDVIYNLRNIQHQESAFWNLFDFYSGKRFPGMTFYAVTPKFAEKCKDVIQKKGRWDFDYSQFDALPTFRMSPLTVKDLELLATRILPVHAAAYQWEPKEYLTAHELNEKIKEAASVQLQDRVRHTIEEVVKTLDQLLDEHS